MNIIVATECKRGLAAARHDGAMHCGIIGPDRWDPSLIHNERRDRVRLRQRGKGKNSAFRRRGHAALFHCGLNQGGRCREADVRRALPVRKPGPPGTFKGNRVRGPGTGWRGSQPGTGAASRAEGGRRVRCCENAVAPASWRRRTAPSPLLHVKSARQKPAGPDARNWRDRCTANRHFRPPGRCGHPSRVKPTFRVTW